MDKLLPRQEAELEAKRTYELFILWTKRSFYIIIGVLLLVTSCSFGVDGTGSKYEPENAKEYEKRMIEMGEKYKK
tara:strand:- start:193 stop:417 length:225 start_codon:yes stop_codon:yes gene_type:complete